MVAARRDGLLEELAEDLQSKFAVQVTPICVDLAGEPASLESFVSKAIEALGGVDYCIIPAGMIDPDDDGSSAEVTRRLTAVNYGGVAEISTYMLQHFEQNGQGTLGLVSSIATAAPRGKNVAYGAAKAALEYFALALQGRYQSTRITVQCYALGYVDTRMTAGMTLKLPKASPEEVAQYIAANLDSGFRHGYFPRFWWWIVTVLRHIPDFLYRKLSF